MLTVSQTFLPSIVILLFFTLSDKFKEPKGMILTIFFLGFLICLPAGILNELSNKFFFDRLNYSEDLTRSFLGPAWAEELLKFLILYLIVLKRDEFNEPMDAIVYGLAVSLGFSARENIDYLLNYEYYQVSYESVLEQLNADVLIPSDLKILSKYKRQYFTSAGILD